MALLEIYTDGSFHTQSLNGSWVAIIFYDKEKFIITGEEDETTQNRMELMAVIRSVEYTEERFPGIQKNIYTDSQYVAGITARKNKLKTNEFITRKGNELPNTDLLKQLISLIEKCAVTFYKVKAHQKSNGQENPNREADMLCRKILRERLKSNRNNKLFPEK